MVFQERTYSVLIVTASDSFTAKIMPLLPVTDYWPVTTVHSIGEARRKIAETVFDIVLINAPLPDDFGMRLAVDICTSSGAGSSFWSGTISLTIFTQRWSATACLHCPSPRICRWWRRICGSSAPLGSGCVRWRQNRPQWRKNRGDPTGQPRQVAADRVPRHD